MRVGGANSFGVRIMKILIRQIFLILSALIAGAAQVQATPRTAFVHLFEWSWNDIAEECRFLGEKGFAAVQISPPQESIEVDTWWARYQPQSYRLDSRSGNREQLKAMVDECRKHGVGIYVDAVINHMSGFQREYPKVPYSVQDFHNCYDPMDYSDRWKIHNCDLASLSDLATETEYVRQMIANYMNDLTSLGVAGFRIDAAKHIPPEDIAAIQAKLQGEPYIFQEVIGAYGEPVSVFEYTGNGDVTEFQYGRALGAAFKGRRALKDLRSLKDWPGWLSSSDAIVFTDNHDTQRGEPFGVMTFKDDGRRYNLANIFMLAYPYGYPKVMSSYVFQDDSEGPPKLGVHTGAACFDGRWVCEHRWMSIANMVEFRNVTSSAFSLDHWWDNGSNQIAFSRLNRGFVAINGESYPLNEWLRTGLPAGVYCDVVSGGRQNGSCSGRMVTVNEAGYANIVLQQLDAIAIHVESRLARSDFETLCDRDPIYVRATANQWGLTPMECQAGLWSKTLEFSDQDEGGSHRFKVALDQNWQEAYPSQDYVINRAGTYRIIFNPQDQSIQVSEQ